MRLAVLGMHRSGTNAIARWLLQQTDDAMGDLKYVGITNWLETNDEGTFSFASQVNHPDHLEWEIYAAEKWVKHSIVTVEREGLQYFSDFCYNHQYANGNCCAIIRDFRNWLASVYKMNGGRRIPDLDVLKYKSHLDALINNRKWIETINYNLWSISAEYRRDITKKFNLKFTDNGFKDVPKNGDGSSFDKTNFDGRGNEMKTLTRWQEFKDDMRFQSMLSRYSNLVYLSDTWIMDVRKL